MRIVEEACGVVGGKLMMVIESNSLSELLDNQVVKFAADHTHQFGWPNACLNGQEAPVPVDDNGRTPEDYNEMVKLANKPNPKFWKRVFFVTRF